MPHLDQESIVLEQQLKATRGLVRLFVMLGQKVMKSKKSVDNQKKKMGKNDV